MCVCVCVCSAPPKVPGKHRIIYVIGLPGAGKSTAVESVLKGTGYRELAEKNTVPHCVYDDGVIMLGKWREKFPGTDAIGFSMQPKVEEWMREIIIKMDNCTMIAEGDRFTNRKFIEACEKVGWIVDIVHITVTVDVAKQRSEHQYTDKRFKSLTTKIANLADKVKYIIDGSLAIGTVAKKLMDILKNDEFHECVLEQDYEEAAKIQDK